MAEFGKFSFALSKAARGRPEGPTERSVFKIIFVMLAVFQLRIRQKHPQVLFEFYSFPATTKNDEVLALV